MAAKRDTIVSAGNDLKFRVWTDFSDFSMAEDNFSIIIKNRWGQAMATIQKDDCFRDTEGNYYFTLENVHTGVYFATFIAELDDDDYEKQTRIRTDIQYIVTVSTCCCNATTPQCSCDHQVHYEQVWTTDVDGTPYLVGRDGEYILTSDGKRIPFLRA